MEEHFQLIYEACLYKKNELKEATDDYNQGMHDMAEFVCAKVEGREANYIGQSE